jgi:hypothetical protein
LISREKLLALYATMVKCRRIAEDPDRRDDLRVSGMAKGWEATVAGITANLVPGDAVLAPRPIEDVLRAVEGEYAGKSEAVPQEMADPGGSSDSTGEGFDKARQLARTFHAAKKGHVAVLFSKAPQKMEHWRKRLPDLVRRNLPLLIVSCEPTGNEGNFTRQKSRNHAVGTLVFGIPVLTVDGGDAMAVYRVAGESIFRARERRGPTLIECVWFPASVPIDATARERRRAALIDPILSMENYLVAKGLLTPGLKGEIVRAFGRELDLSNRMFLH